MNATKFYSALSLFLLLCSLSFAKNSKTQEFKINSPDGAICLTINADKSINWSVTYNSETIIHPSEVSLSLDTGEILGENLKLIKAEKFQQSGKSIASPFYKKSTVADNYNGLRLMYKGNLSIEFRVHDDGVAYRYCAQRKGDITVTSELANFNFGKDCKAFVPYMNDMRDSERYSSSFESYYDEIPFSQMKADSLSLNPLLVDLGEPLKAVILESDVEDYPGMYLKVNENHTGLKAEFAPAPLEGHYAGYANINFIATKRADYLAKTSGSRTFPWRAVVISRQDKDLANNDMAYRLASPSRIEDMSWIKPGKAAWDWWNNTGISGVDFLAGMNTPTFKYFIDFAAANGLEYILIDAGWTVGAKVDPQKSRTSPYLLNVVPALDLQELVNYGNQKNVGILLWANWMLTDLEKDIVFPHYAKMGIKGFKVDFLDSDDQKMMNSAFDIARVAAENHLLLDFHGFRPTGISRTYPNVVNFEGVKGLENMKWADIEDDVIVHDQPRYDVTIPFIRMMAGPMDYTPGAMRNANYANFRAIGSFPYSQGTRVHQMAMYTIYEAPLQMLSDSPTAYMKEEECTSFISKVPTVFDETVALDGRLGEYVAIARRKGDTWYVAAMTNWNSRDMVIDLSFLGEGSFTAEIFSDGINANRQACDYKKGITTVTAQDKLTIKMANGGGWTAIIK